MKGNDTMLSHNDFDLYIFGFQEIVQLTGSSMVSASIANMRAWEQVLLHKINKERDSDNQVVLARSDQLVGIAIIIFVRKSLAGHLRNVTFETVKSGVRGLAGNKGAICARFDLKDTSIFCAVCHIAAGQSKTEQRIKDIQDISNVRFRVPDCTKMNDHDYLFWMGDFNFRVGITRQEADNLIGNNQWQSLLEYDQFTIGQKKMGGILQDTLNQQLHSLLHINLILELIDMILQKNNESHLGVIEYCTKPMMVFLTIYFTIMLKCMNQIIDL
jgi:phosphatidylinositol-bisphosphatase